MSIMLTSYGGFSYVKPGNGIWKVTVGPNKVYEGYNPSFGANSLEKIKQACQRNEIPSSWHVGDEKTITYTYNGNSYTDRIVLVDKTEGRYEYTSDNYYSDNNYTHATFMIVPSRIDSYLTGGTSGTTNKKYSANTTFQSDIYSLWQRYNVTSNDGTNLTSLLEEIKIKSMTGSSSATEDFACYFFIPSCCELAVSGLSPTTGNTTASYKTGSNLGNFELFVNSPVVGSDNVSRYEYYFGYAVNIWSRDYTGSSNRYYYYKYNDSFVRTRTTATTCADIVCFSW